MFLAAALLAPAGCRQSAPQSDAWESAGFIRHVPSEAEGYLALSRPADIWKEAAPAWSALREDEALRSAWGKSSTGRIVEAFLVAPAAAPLWESLGEIWREETFIMLGPGTGAQLASLQQVKRLFEAARLRNLFTPLSPGGVAWEDEADPSLLPDDLSAAAFTEVMMPLPPAMEEALENFVSEAVIPPLLLGAKLPPDARLPGILAAWVENLPPQVPRDTVTIGGHGEFTRTRVPVTLLVPTEAAVRARDLLAVHLGDPYTATYIVRNLLSKTTTIAFGRVHGFFVVSLGSESGLPELAPDPGASLVSTPAMQRIAPLLGPEMHGLLYADALIVSLAASPPPVGEYLDAALESALEFAPAHRIRPLRAAARPLREQAAELFRPRISTVSGILRREPDRWQTQLFGGSMAPRLSTGNTAPLLGFDDSLDFLWTEHWEENYAQRLLEFTAGAARFSTDWMDALGPVFLDPAKRPAMDNIIRTLPGGAAHLAEVAAELEKSLDRRVALAAAMDGALPAAPLLPPAFTHAILPRVAVAAGLADRSTLASLWQEFTDAPGARAWPPPVETELPGSGVTYSYPIPFAGPDLAPCITVTGSRWIAGTSPDFNALLAKSPEPDRTQGAVQTIDLETAPLAAFAAALADALEEDPSLSPLTGGILPQDPLTLDAIAAVLQTPRRFHYHARWENDAIHRVLELSAVPSP